MEPSSAPWRVLDTSDQHSPQGDKEPRGFPRAAIGTAILAVLVAAAALLVVTRPPADVVIDEVGVIDAGAAGQGGTESEAPASAPRTLVIEVAGAVLHPGVYHLPAGARIGDALAAAGGYGPAVDALLADRQLNLAAPVRDGDEVRVPARGEAPAEASVVVGATAAGGNAAQGGNDGAGLVDLNHATAEQLDTLPGVGPATAAKTIAAREEKPFASVDELVARKVVGPTTLEKLRQRVTVAP